MHAWGHLLLSDGSCLECARWSMREEANLLWKHSEIRQLPRRMYTAPSLMYESRPLHHIDCCPSLSKGPPGRHPRARAEAPAAIDVDAWATWSVFAGWRQAPLGKSSHAWIKRKTTAYLRATCASLFWKPALRIELCCAPCPKPLCRSLL